MQALLLCLLPVAPWIPAQQEALPRVVVSADDTRIDKSCMVVLAPDQVIADANGDGVIHVVAAGIRVVFAPGSVLRGAAPTIPANELSGVGVRLEGVSDVVLENLAIEGYRCAILATSCDRLRVDGAQLRRNFGQLLKSSPEAEDGSDWLWPHANDEQQWRRNYGAGLSIHRSRDVVVRRVVAREQQNGILLDRVEGAKVYDNDCSFLSGWGLAMWRSSHNLISRNAFDFCIRGYSHGVYNRGQDSAGILAFEQCSNNVFVENSATHGGDGFFGFAGQEALGEGTPPSPDFSCERRGNNDNLFLRNDFSYAAAHGLELTFSFGNQIRDNQFSGNAICGIWGGFSQDTLIAGNHLRANGDRGYGLERGGVNIDHSRGNRLLGNRFEGNRCGVHLWALPTGFSDKPWGLANSLLAEGNLVAGNHFDGDEVAVHLRGAVHAWNKDNVYSAVGEGLQLEGEAKWREPHQDPLPAPGVMAPALGESRPVGARVHLAGRENIIMTEWGPWDHHSPFLQSLRRGPDEHLYKVHPVGVRPKVRSLIGGHADAIQMDFLTDEDGGALISLKPQSPGFHSYSFHVQVGERNLRAHGSMLLADWELTLFASPVDPRQELAAWRAAAEGEGAVHLRTPGLRLPFGSGGPQQLTALAGHAGLPGADHFGTIARTRLRLPAGRWKVQTLSDDGIRVVADGRTLIDNWTWHGPTRDEGVLELEQAAEVDLLVEHFELDGYSVLEFEIVPAD